MSDLETIKAIAEQMPESPEKQKALQAYSNLKTFEVIADSFDQMMITGAVMHHPTRGKTVQYLF